MMCPESYLANVSGLFPRKIKERFDSPYTRLSLSTPCFKAADYNQYIQETEQQKCLHDDNYSLHQ